MAKKGVKKNSKKVSKKQASCDIDCNCNIGSLKLASIAFTLFLVQVWPWLKGVAMSVHWGWYLATMIIFGACSMKKACWCKK